MCDLTCRAICKALSPKTRYLNAKGLDTLLDMAWHQFEPILKSDVKAQPFLCLITGTHNVVADVAGRERNGTLVDCLVVPTCLHTADTWGDRTRKQREGCGFSYINDQWELKQVLTSLEVIPAVHKTAEVKAGYFRGMLPK